MALKATKGIIEEVSTDRECRQYCATIGEKGFKDDRSGTPGIVLVNSKVVHYINKHYQMLIMAGQLGDNILVKGMMEVSALPAGTLIKINEKVILRVESKADHYRQMFPTFPEPVLMLLEARGGVICSVVQGIGERVCDDQDIEALVLVKEELKGAA